MARSCLIEKEKKKFILHLKYNSKIKKLKKIIKNKNSSYKDIYNANLLLQKIPKNAHLVRKRNRCFITGRARGFFRRFGLSRNLIRELAFKGDIPGIIKSS